MCCDTARDGASHVVVRSLLHNDGTCKAYHRDVFEYGSVGYNVDGIVCSSMGTYSSKVLVHLDPQHTHPRCRVASMIYGVACYSVAAL